MVVPDLDAISDMSQLPEESFAPQRLRSGDAVEGEVVSIDEEGLVVNIGAKTEGMVPAAEMRTLEPEERENLSVGDRLPLTFLRAERGRDMALLSFDRARRSQLWADFRQNLNDGQTVTAKITGYNRGGLEVDIKGEPFHNIWVFYVI